MQYSKQLNVQTNSSQFFIDCTLVFFYAHNKLIDSLPTTDKITIKSSSLEDNKKENEDWNISDDDEDWNTSDDDEEEDLFSFETFFSGLDGGERQRQHLTMFRQRCFGNV